jgi:DNA-binding transcriptional regulator YhcF (GntR family)
LLPMPIVDRTPPYMQVVAHYQDKIRSGELQPGSVMPSVRRLATDWQIGQSTAQKAIDALRDGGWIETRPGRTSVVTSRHSPPSHTPP